MTLALSTRAGHAILIVVFIGLMLAYFGLLAMVVVDLSQRSDMPTRRKVVIVVLAVLIPIVGAAVYLIANRSRRPA